MPARIVVALQEPGLSEQVVSSLKTAGHDAVALPDSMIALDALESAARIEVLATSVNHQPGKPNGVALARMARLKRPGIKVIFIGPPETARHSAGLGDFLPSPAPAPAVAARITQLLEPGPSEASD